MATPTSEYFTMEVNGGWLELAKYAKKDTGP